MRETLFNFNSSRLLGSIRFVTVLCLMSIFSNLSFLGARQSNIRFLLNVVILAFLLRLLFQYMKLDGISASAKVLLYLCICYFASLTIISALTTEINRSAFTLFPNILLILTLLLNRSLLISKKAYEKQQIFLRGIIIVVISALSIPIILRNQELQRAIDIRMGTFHVLLCAFILWSFLNRDKLMLFLSLATVFIRATEYLSSSYLILFLLLVIALINHKFIKKSFLSLAISVLFIALPFFTLQLINILSAFHLRGYDNIIIRKQVLEYAFLRIAESPIFGTAMSQPLFADVNTSGTTLQFPFHNDSVTWVFATGYLGWILISSIYLCKVYINRNDKLGVLETTAILSILVLGSFNPMIGASTSLLLLVFILNASFTTNLKKDLSPEEKSN